MFRTGYREKTMISECRDCIYYCGNDLDFCGRGWCLYRGRIDPSDYDGYFHGRSCRYFIRERRRKESDPSDNETN